MIHALSGTVPRPPNHIWWRRKKDDTNNDAEEVCPLRMGNTILVILNDLGSWSTILRVCSRMYCLSSSLMVFHPSGFLEQRL